MSGLRLIFAASIGLNLVLLCSLIWGRQGIVEYERLSEQCRTLEERIAALDEENIILSREIRLLQSDAGYVEKIVRNRLHFLRDDELLYIFPDGAEALSNEAKN